MSKKFFVLFFSILVLFSGNAFSMRRFIAKKVSTCGHASYNHFDLGGAMRPEMMRWYAGRCDNAQDQELLEESDLDFQITPEYLEERLSEERAKTDDLFKKVLKVVEDSYQCQRKATREKKEEIQAFFKGARYMLWGLFLAWLLKTNSPV